MIFVTVLLLIAIMWFLTTKNRYLQLGDNLMMFIVSVHINACLVCLSVDVGCNEDLTLFSLFIVVMLMMVVVNVYKLIKDCPHYEGHYVTKMIFTLNIITLSVTISLLIASYNTIYFSQFC